jgi:hypothetical protein
VDSRTSSTKIKGNSWVGEVHHICCRRVTLKAADTLWRGFHKACAEMLARDDDLKEEDWAACTICLYWWLMAVDY